VAAKAAPAQGNLAKQLEALRKENEALKLKVQLRGKQAPGTSGEGDADMEDVGEGDGAVAPISALIETIKALGAVGAPQEEIAKYQAMLDARRQARDESKPATARLRDADKRLRAAKKALATQEDLHKAAQTKVQEAIKAAEEACQAVQAAKATVAEREAAYAAVAKSSAPDPGSPGLAGMVEQIEAIQRSTGSGSAMDGLLAECLAVARKLRDEEAEKAKAQAQQPGASAEEDLRRVFRVLEASRAKAEGKGSGAKGPTADQVGGKGGLAGLPDVGLVLGGDDASMPEAERYERFRKRCRELELDFGKPPTSIRKTEEVSKRP
jgi:hypothetical protein